MSKSWWAERKENALQSEPGCKKIVREDKLELICFRNHPQNSGLCTSDPQICIMSIVRKHIDV